MGFSTSQATCAKHLAFDEFRHTLIFCQPALAFELFNDHLGSSRVERCQADLTGFTIQATGRNPFLVHFESLLK
jgi:hypothetical protein